MRYASGVRWRSGVDVSPNIAPDGKCRPACTPAGNRCQRRTWSCGPWQGVAMITGQDPDLHALQTVTGNLVDFVASIAIDEWDSTTPCSDWNLSALVDHVTGGNWFTLMAVAGMGAGEAMTETVARFDDVPVTNETAIQSLKDQEAAFQQTKVFDRVWNHIAGDLSGRQILRLRLHDLIVHSWDLEQSLRREAPLDVSLVRWGLDDLAREDSLAAEHFGSGDSAPAGLDNADPTHRYLRVFGR